MTQRSEENNLLKVIGQTETPFGMMDLREILVECTEVDKFLQFEAFVFGSDDFLASIGMPYFLY